MSAPANPRPLRVSIHALGGQGGGVLADWIVDLAEHAGYVAQATSVPGVAQRTGATVYYVELCPPAADGREPVLALMPIPGDVDLVIAAELMEAGRAIARGLVTPDRTTLVVSSHRVMAIAEKSDMGDGTIDARKVLDAAQASARRLVLGDLDALAQRRGSVISAALFGAVAGSGALPFPREAFEAAIERGGVGVAASLKAFAAAFDQAEGRAPPEPPAPTAEARPAPRDAAGLRRRLAETLPQAAWALAGLGVERCLDYQGPAYAGLYLERLAETARLDRQFGGEAFGWRLTCETARHLALWMTFEDVIRVADLKTRPARFERVRREVRAADGQIVHMSEFMHPRFEEACDTLPDAIGRRLKDSGLARRLFGGAFAEGRQVTTSRLGGFLLLYAIAALRPMRPASHRFKAETGRIEAWLASAANAARADYDLAVEVVRLQRLVKGYGETHERGLRSYGAILHVVGGLIERGGAAAACRRLAEAALKDESGRLLAREIEALGAPAMAPVPAL